MPPRLRWFTAGRATHIAGEHAKPLRQSPDTDRLNDEVLDFDAVTPREPRQFEPQRLGVAPVDLTTDLESLQLLRGFHHQSS
jgi:hypothetical protein